MLVSHKPMLSSGGHGEEDLYLPILRDTPRRLGSLRPKGNFKIMMRARFNHPWTAVEQQLECEQMARSALTMSRRLARSLEQGCRSSPVHWQMLLGTTSSGRNGI
jgi:hypothetical protein